MLISGESRTPKPVRRSLPATASLALRFEPRLLGADLSVLRGQRWRPEQPFDATGPADPLTHDWTALALRSQGGDPVRTDPGGPGLEDFADTKILARTPYLREVLRRIPCDLRSARLLALAPNGVVAEHTDPHHGFDVGQVRLHVPIVTNPAAKLVIDGVRHHWPVGQLWYGDFSRPHSLYNEGTTTRIHLVVDCLVNQAILSLLPSSFRDALPHDSVLLNRSPVEAGAETLSRFRCRFTLPRQVLRSASQGRQGVGLSEAQIDFRGERLTLFTEDGPCFGLTYLGGGDFRFAGWTEERTVRIHSSGGVPDSAAIRIRNGRRVRELKCPAVPLRGNHGAA